MFSAAVACAAMIDGALSDWLRIGKVDPPCWCPVFPYGVAAVAAGEPAHSKTAWNKIPSFKSTCVVPKNTRYSTQHFDVKKASDLLAIRRAISGGLFHTPGRDVALATMDSATATVAALPAEQLYVSSPNASVSWIVARPTFDSGKARGASNIGGLSDTE